MSEEATSVSAYHGRRKEDGNAVVEFGLVLPFLLILLLGIIDWGHVHFARLTLANAAREGARVGITRALTAEAEEHAEQRALEYLTGSGVGGAEIDAEMHRDFQYGLTVTVTLPFKPLLGFVPTPRKLEAQSVMRWELAP